MALYGDAYGHPSGGRLISITESTIDTEDLDMFSVLTNRTITKGFPGTIGAVATQRTRGGYQFRGYLPGIAVYDTAIASLQSSPQCNDLTDAVWSMDYVIANGSQLPANYLFWKGVLQPGRRTHVAHAGDIYVARTVFGTQN